MANLEDEVTGRTGSNVYADDEDNGPSSREIRREIERTRSQMDRNLDALEQKLTPSQLALEAWGLFRGGSTAGASRLWRIAKQHPGPAAVIGVGLNVQPVHVAEGPTEGEEVEDHLDLH